MSPELKVNAVVCNRAVTWELVEETIPALLPLVPEWDDGSDFVEVPSCVARPMLTLVARRAA